MQYLSDKQLAERYGVGRATVWRWVAAGKFPKPIKLSPGCTRWQKSVVDQHEKAKGAV